MTDQPSPTPPEKYPYVWRIKAQRPERYLQPCRVIKWTPHIEIEFEDGERVLASRDKIRRRPTVGIYPNRQREGDHA